MIFRFWKKLPIKTAARVFNLQKESYKVESKLLKYKKLPPLMEDFLDFQELTDLWLVCYFQGKPVGALAFEVNRQVEISRLFVAPAWFGNSVASRMLKKLAKRFPAKSLMTATAAKNKPALAMYWKNGFQVAGEFVTTDGLGILKMTAPAVYRLKRI